MGKFLDEFKSFAMKGNAVDMAVGVIIGGAFGKIVSSIVDDIIMPPIGWLIGGVNFSDLKVTLPTVYILVSRRCQQPRSIMGISSRRCSILLSSLSVSSCW